MSSDRLEIDATLQAQIDRARQAGEVLEETEPRAVEAWYEIPSERIFVEIQNGVVMGFPYELLQGLESATPEQLTEVEVTPSGYGLYWKSLDVDLGVPQLIEGIFGTKGWMSELGRLREQAKAVAKAEVSKERRIVSVGGRPRKAETSFDSQVSTSFSMMSQDLFQEDIKKIIEFLPIKRLNKKDKIESTQKHRNSTRKNLASKTKSLSLKFISSCFHFFWLSRSKVEKVVLAVWISMSLIPIGLALFMSIQIANIQTINIKLRLIFVIAYIFFSLAMLMFFEFSLIFGSHQKKRSKDFEITRITHDSFDFCARALQISRLNLTHPKDSIEAIQETFERKLDRQKYIEKMIPEISIILAIFLVLYLYLFYGDKILTFLNLWNLPSKETSVNNIQALGSSINFLFKGTFFATIIFIIKIWLNSITRSEIITLQSCVSVLKYAKSFYKERASKES
jgi:hypothetical protein